MLLMRLLACLASLLIAGGVAGYLLTHDPRYIRFSLGVFRYTIFVVLLIFALLILERAMIRVL